MKGWASSAAQAPIALDDDGSLGVAGERLDVEHWCCDPQAADDPTSCGCSDPLGNTMTYNGDTIPLQQSISAP